MQSSVTDAANQTLRLRESKSLHAPHPHAISADSGAGLVAAATDLRPPRRTLVSVDRQGDLSPQTPVSVDR